MTILVVAQHTGVESSDHYGVSSSVIVSNKKEYLVLVCYTSMWVNANTPASVKKWLRLYVIILDLVLVDNV